MTKRVRLTDVPTADTWAAMEKLVQAGKVRSVGISNFTIAKTQELLKTSTIPPAVNQIEAHPFLQQPELMEFMKDNVSEWQRIFCTAMLLIDEKLENPCCRL